MCKMLTEVYKYVEANTHLCSEKYSSYLQVYIYNCIQIYEWIKSLLFPKMEIQIRNLFQLWCFCFGFYWTLLRLQISATTSADVFC